MKIQKLVDLQPIVDLIFEKNFESALAQFKILKGELGQASPLLMMDLELIEMMLQSQTKSISSENLAHICSWFKIDWSKFDSPTNMIAVLINAGVVLALSNDFESAKKFFSICSREIGRHLSIIPTKYLIRNIYHLGLVNKILGNEEEGAKLAVIAGEIAKQTVLYMYSNHPEGLSLVKLKDYDKDLNAREFPFWFELGSVPIQILPRS